jgi:hypothetical protein
MDQAADYAALREVVQYLHGSRRRMPRKSTAPTQKRRDSYAPVPDNVTFCGLPEALSVTLNAAGREPFTVGLKVTLIVQLAPAASEAPHVCV